MPFRWLASGAILVDVVPADTGRWMVVYARVWSHDQRSDLDRQVARLTEWAGGHGHEVARVVTEVGSGLAGSAPSFAGFCRIRLPR